MKLYLSSTEFIDTSQPLDISLELSNDGNNPIAWYVEPPVFEPVRTEHYTGSVSEGGTVNFRDIFFNPHGHGTHTECLGHITDEVYSVNERLKEYFFRAQLISLEPQKVEHSGDHTVDSVITAEQLSFVHEDVDALIIRTLPNEQSKKSRNYSSSNPPYLEAKGAEVLKEKGIIHLLVDLPSVDRENDNGELVFHHAFWDVPEKPNHVRTITELVFVDNGIEDGIYIMNLQMAAFKNDASPSRPVLYRIKKELK